MKSEAGSLDALLQQGLNHHQAGRLAEAENLYRQVLAAAPAHPYALNFLGVLASQVGQHAIAAELLQKAVASNARLPEFHNNLGLALQACGKLEEAETGFRQAIAINGKFPEAYNNLGTLLQEQGRLDEAARSFEKALKLKPNYAEAAFNAGNVYTKQQKCEAAIGRFKLAIKFRPNYAKAYCGMGLAQQRLSRKDAAEKSFRRAIELQPGFAEAYSNLGAFLRETGRLEEAKRSFAEALRINPQLAEAYNGLGELHQCLGDMRQAERNFCKAIELKPDYPEAHNNLGVLQAGSGRLQTALESYRKALAIRPDFVYALNNMGIIYADMGHLDDAMDCYRRALEQAPSFGMAYSNLGNVYRELGRLDQARASYEQALAISLHGGDVTQSNLGTILMAEGKLDEAKTAYQRAMAMNPANPVTHSNLIFLMDFDSRHNVADQQAERRRWNELYAAPFKGNWPVYRNDRSPGRKLKVGYVSADFRMHSASYAFGPLLCHYDQERFEVYCYSNSARNDQQTALFRNSVSVWRNILGVEDEELAAMILADGIDILVDLSAHSAGNRLLAFARKSAPIQVTGWGHANGTGLDAMDYLVSDAVSIPPEDAPFYAEEIIYLPCQLSYSCPEDAPEIAAAPVRKRGRISFGCFNKLAKVGDDSFRLWADILQAVPDARLVLKAKELSDESQRQRVLGMFDKYGIAADRLSLMGGTNWHEHLQAYREVDIALDPLTYGGGITTFEALWMGCPVITLKGRTLTGRISAAIETALDMGEWVVGDADAYLKLASAWALRGAELDRIRQGMRARLLNSPIGNPQRYMQLVEAEYRRIWERWCAQ